MTRLTSTLLAGVLVFSLGLAAAQPAGAIELTVGFAPDPQIVNVTAGGEINGAAVDGKACAGYRSDAATIVVTVPDGLPVLYLYASAETATTLVVRAPDGSLLCDGGNGGARDPLIAIEAPATGEYLIWVGGLSAPGAFDAALMLSATPIDPAADAIYGQTDMAAAETRSGLENTLIAGGLTPAAAASSACLGYVSVAPTYTYIYTPGAFSLAALVVSGADTVLLIRGPDGAWRCDDDGGGEANPLVVIDTPAAGRYDFWLGTKTPAFPVDRPGDEFLSGLVDWFVGDGAGEEATLYFFEFVPGCTLEPAIPGAQRC